MNVKRVKIVAIYRHKILYRNNREIHKKEMIASAVLFVMLMLSAIFLRVQDSSMSQAVSQAFTNISDPTFPLYGDMSELVHTNGSIIPEFKLPVIGSKVEVINGDINITIADNNTIKSTHAGRIRMIGIDDGKRYVQIMYDNDLSTIIYNMDVIGVKTGDVVAANSILGTAEKGQVITVQVLYCDDPIENVWLKNGRILWKQ